MMNNFKTKKMKTIKIQGNNFEYTFTQHENENQIFYNFYENDKLIHQAIDTGDEIEFNGESFGYCDFAEMYLFLRAIRKSDKQLIGKYKAISETKLFDL